MRRYHQTEWQDIQFSDFSRLSSTNLAGPTFYQAFYEEFFRRYQRWGQLSSDWLKQKERCAELVLARSGDGARILSVGCGLGTMEHYLHVRNPQLDLFIHEVAPSAWRWIDGEFAAERKFLGLIPGCLPDGIRFDLVYLSAVDYALDDGALVGLLAALRQFLAAPGGQCLLISASFQITPVSAAARVVSLLRRLKALAAAALDAFGLRPRGQFWGWLRTQEEYRSLLRRAGYGNIEDGFIEHEDQAQYWIAGR